MSADFPLPGTFIRPVGGGSFSYCYEVAAVVLNDDRRPGAQLQCRLWHMDTKTGQPTDWPAWMPSPPAGHPMRYVDAVPACPGVWRNTFTGWGDVRYWRRMDATLGGQMELFS